MTSSQASLALLLLGHHCSASNFYFISVILNFQVFYNIVILGKFIAKMVKKYVKQIVLLVSFFLLPCLPHPLATSSIGAVGDEVTVTVPHLHTPTVDVTFLLILPRQNQVDLNPS